MCDSAIIESQNYKRLSECKDFPKLGHRILPGNSVNCSENSIEKRHNLAGKYFVTSKNQGIGVV